jgi:hypothetical protein
MSAWCSSGYYFGINFLELETGALMVKQALMSNVFDMSEVGRGMVIGRVGQLSVREQKKLWVEIHTCTSDFRWVSDIRRV